MLGTFFKKLALPSRSQKSRTRSAEQNRGNIALMPDTYSDTGVSQPRQHPKHTKGLNPEHQTRAWHPSSNEHCCFHPADRKLKRFTNQRLPAQTTGGLL